MKILVTGSAGFIGSSLTLKLLERGDEVVGVDNHNDYYDPTLKEARLMRHLNHQNYTHKRIDIKERKLTLPLIHVLQKVSKEKRRLIVNTIKKDKQDPAKVKKIISMVIENGGIDYAERKMNEYKDLAIKELEKLPPSSAKEAFIGLIHYSINRKK